MHVDATVNLQTAEYAVTVPCFLSYICKRFDRSKTDRKT